MLLFLGMIISWGYTGGKEEAKYPSKPITVYIFSSQGGERMCGCGTFRLLWKKIWEFRCSATIYLVPTGEQRG